VSPTGPRIAPLPPDEWGGDAVAALRAAFGDGAADRFLSGPDAPPVPNVLSTLLRHPALTGPFMVYNAVLLNSPTLEPRWRELMVLRVAARAHSEYEWVQHVRIARACGITDAEVEAIAAGVVTSTLSPLEADLLAATDELLDRYRIADTTWARLAAQLDERQLVEVAFVVGTYTALAMAFNSFGIELDPELLTLGAPPLPPAEES
jgi:alkylhydroperoxidase family enzyme